MVEIGDKLSGRYVISQPIGQGGMANVFLARDLILDRDVAVKILRFDFQEDQDAIRRFQREAMSASQLLHHNIVEVYDVDDEGGQQYIIMEYVDGTDLKSYIRKNSPISLELIVNIMSQILSGIDLAHRHGIIHRDIKPQNILITQDNEVKITDFGIAVALSDTSITQTNTLLGSVHYLSPEQARGNNATPKSDIYALGVVLYELITGEVPFDGESAVSIALKHFQENFPRILPDLDYVPQSLENVVLRATAKDPEDRYPNVQAMLQDISTSLSASRMNEQAFEPKTNTEDTIVMKTIKPLEKPEKKVVSPPPAPSFEEIPDYGQVQAVQLPRRRPRLWAWLGLLVLAAILLGGGYIAYQRFIQYVSIPDVTNLSQAEASQVLEEANIAVGSIENAWHNTILPGNAIETRPASGNRIPRGSQVDLIISSGKEQVEVGNYVGEDYETVRRLLTHADFIVERRDLWTNDDSQVGVILDQSIPAGTAVVPSQTPITLTVGTTGDSAQMQDFYNLSLSLVYNFADGYGLYVDEVYEHSDYIPEGQIISQEPEPGTPLVPGDTIFVTVSAGPEDQEMTTQYVDVYVDYIPKYHEADTNQERPLPNTVQVFIGDAYNQITDVAEEFEISESRSFRITLYIARGSTGQYRVVRDGDVVEESNQVYP